MKTLHPLLAGLAAIGLVVIPIEGIAGPISIVSSAITITHDPGDDIAVAAHDVGPVFAPFMAFHTDTDAVTKSFTQAAAGAFPLFNPFFFGFSIATGTGINQFNADEAGAALDPSTLRIDFEIEYQFGTGFALGWIQFAVMPLLSITLLGSDDIVEFHLDMNFAGNTVGVIGPGVDIDFINDGDGVLLTTLVDVETADAAIPDDEIMTISGFMEFSASDPQAFASIFTIAPGGLNFPVPEPAPIAFLGFGVGLILVAARHRSSARTALARSRNRVS